MFYVERWPMGLGPEPVDRGQYLREKRDRREKLRRGARGRAKISKRKA
jgi:hypothetical protein